MNQEFALSKTGSLGPIHQPLQHVGAVFAKAGFGPTEFKTRIDPCEVTERRKTPTAHVVMQKIPHSEAN